MIEAHSVPIFHVLVGFSDVFLVTLEARYKPFLFFIFAATGY